MFIKKFPRKDITWDFSKFTFETKDNLRPKIRAFVPRRENRATQWISPADVTRKKVYCQLRKPGDSDLLGGRAHRTANWASFYRQKTTLSACYIRVTKWLVTRLQSNPIGTNCAAFCSNLKQFYWHKRRGLLFKRRCPRAFQLSRGLLLGAYWLAGSRSPDGGGESYHFTGNLNPSPGRLPAPSPSSPT